MAGRAGAFVAAVIATVVGIGASALEAIGRAVCALPVWLGRTLGLTRERVHDDRRDAGQTQIVARARYRRGLERMDTTSGFARVAARHARDRVSRRALVIAVLVILAVIAARVEAGPRVVVPPVIASDGCDEDGCDEEPLADIIPQVVTTAGSRAEVSGNARELGADGCECGSGMPLPVSAVADAAIRAAGLDDDPVPGWNKRARLAGLVPTISARAGRNLTWREIDDPTLGYTTMIDIRATWHLERLMFDPNELRISNIDVSRRREKRRIEMLATHTYAAWLAAPRPSGRAALLAADLDAITDGWFSTALATKPSERPSP